MLVLRLEPEIKQRLKDEEFFEDEEDYLIATERLKNKLPAISFAEVKRLLGSQD